jgi:hypothetical protein
MKKIFYIQYSGVGKEQKSGKRKQNVLDAKQHMESFVCQDVWEHR